MIDRVSALLEEVVAEEVMPRFGALHEAEITGKPTPGDPDDVVTVVDHAVERRLGPALQALLPGSVVIGEEAVHDRPDLIAGLSGSVPVWLIDPIDGTKNFARGEDTFGVMIALVEGGATRAGWIALPARGQMFVGEHGAGAYLDRRRVRTQPRPAGLPRGTIYTQFLPASLAEALGLAASGWCEPVEGPGAAAIEYTAIIQGQKEFVVYYRLKPWDHGAGALLLTEAGGSVEHLDRRPYLPASEDQVTILGASVSVCATVRAALAGLSPGDLRP
jgi:fructose-1,6-bisphosphatase/inositol monophosphatase family enzyme